MNADDKNKQSLQGEGNLDGQAQPPKTDDDNGNKSAPKMFTEEEVKAYATEVAKKEVGKVKAKMPTEEELKELEDYKKSKLTEQERIQAEKEANLAKEKTLQDKERAIEAREQKSIIAEQLAQLGVSVNAADFIHTKIEDFENLEDSINKVLEANPYLLPQEEAKPRARTGYEGGGTGKPEKTRLERLLARQKK